MSKNLIDTLTTKGFACAAATSTTILLFVSNFLTLICLLEKSIITNQQQMDS